MKKGTIVLIPFPYTDLSGYKVRPAILLSCNDIDLTVCFVTSELKMKTECDFSVLPSETNGLKVKSYIRADKIVTIDVELVYGILGDFSDSEVKKLDICLKNAFQLW